MSDAAMTDGGNGAKVGVVCAPTASPATEATCLSPVAPGVIRQLIEAGRFAEVVRFLRDQSYTRLESNPELALLFGIALARIGRQLEGRHWTLTALRGAQDRGLGDVEARAFNALGALAFEAGEMPEAKEHWLKARAIATKLGDYSTVGRCSNNIGILENLLGRYGQAVGAYTVAVAAYERSRFPHGAAESRHNLAITHRDRGNLRDAFEAANLAVEGAREIQDTELLARALAGRAEIRVALGEPAAAVQDIEEALALHRKLEDIVDEAEDLRVLGVALATAGDVDGGEAVLRDAIVRARRFERPLLQAAARRDLAGLLRRLGRVDEAQVLAATAREQFAGCGAVAEVRKLDALMDEMGTAQVTPS
jgi:tetratricopeptide (TPR) repeat protein